MTAMADNAPSQKPPRQITGRMVLFALIAFFGLIFAVNAYMIYVALSTFGGVETASAYKVGLAYDTEIAAAQAQESRAWKVEATLSGNDKGRTVQLGVLGKSSAPETGLMARARLSHPGDRRQDVELMLAEVSPGLYRASYAAPAGYRDLVIELFRGEERMFRSRSRVTLP
jgi:nitrogen fixation protein FixH